MPAEPAKASATGFQTFLLPFIFVTGICSGVLLESRVLSSTGTEVKPPPSESTEASVTPSAQLASSASTGTPVIPLPPKPDAAILKIESHTFDFGERLDQEVVENSFVLINEGTRPLVVRQIGIDCGWISTHLKENVIAPGTSANLTIQAPLKGRKGPQKQLVTVTTNATVPVTEITIQGAVRTAANGEAPEAKP